MGWSSVNQSRLRLLLTGILALGFRGEEQARGRRASRASAGLGGWVGLADPGRCRVEDGAAQEEDKVQAPARCASPHPRVKRAKKNSRAPERTDAARGSKIILDFSL